MKRAPGTRKRRADAKRNIASIVDAAVECFSRRPDASMADVAAAAGVGRVTLYAHFPSREALLDAAIDHVVTRVMATLNAARIDEGPAPEALGRMIHDGWPAFDRVWGLRVAAGTQSPRWVREHSARFLARVEHLISRGQAEGSFRTDLPRDWLVVAFHSLVHAAGQEVDEGRLDQATVADVLEATLSAILAAHGERTPADSS